MRDKANDPGHRYLIDILDHFILLDLFYSLNNFFANTVSFFSNCQSSHKRASSKTVRSLLRIWESYDGQVLKSNKTR